MIEFKKIDSPVIEAGVDDVDKTTAFYESLLLNIDQAQTEFYSVHKKIKQVYIYLGSKEYHMLKSHPAMAQHAQTQENDFFLGFPVLHVLQESYMHIVIEPAE